MCGAEGFCGLSRRDSSWAILEGQITIVLESTSHEKTGATGAGALEARVSRMTFDESGLCADPSKMLEMPQIIVRNRPTRDQKRAAETRNAHSSRGTSFARTP
jgi:hypothetical protein